MPGFLAAWQPRLLPVHSHAITGHLASQRWHTPFWPSAITPITRSNRKLCGPSTRASCRKHAMHAGVACGLCSRKQLTLQMWSLTDTLNRSRIPLRAAVAVETAEEYVGQSVDVAEQEQGPAARHTMGLLEWDRLCEQVAQFASTELGRAAVLKLRVPKGLAESEVLLRETMAADALESRFAISLDFGGISTGQASGALWRAGRGGLVSGSQLSAIASITAGGLRLQKAISMGANQARNAGQDTEVLGPIMEAMKAMQLHPDVAREIGRCLDVEDGRVLDGASEAVRAGRTRVRAAEGRLRGILKGYPGEVSNYGSKLCVVMAATAPQPRGIVLGTSTGGGSVYVEPTAAIPLNNELGEARAVLQAAEEDVLWKLTGLVADAAEGLQGALDTIVNLDNAVSRARYGRWTEGTIPEFAPFSGYRLPRDPGNAGDPQHEGTGAPSSSGEEGLKNRKKRRRGGGRGGGGAGAVGLDEDTTDEGLLIRVKKLRHPLLLGDWLMEQRKRGPGGGPRMTKQARALMRATMGNRRDVMLTRRSQLDAVSQGLERDKDSSSSDTDGESDGDEDGPQPPVPFDCLIRPAIKAVIITGPNTGGKTATLKALGLAVLMAKAGLPIPADPPARLPCFNHVLADIGDEQSLTANLSTFSGHLSRIDAIRRESNSLSLVLLDEVGTGTDPREGAALGIGLLRVLVRGGPRGAGLVLATTHHGSLSGLKYQDPRFENASVEFDEEKLAPTYRLQWGIPGRSNALNIAQRYGIPQPIIEDARSMLGQQQAGINERIMELERLRRETEAHEEATAKAQRKIKDVERQIDDISKQLEDRDAKLLEEYNRELARLVQDARDAIADAAERKKLEAAVVRAEAKQSAAKAAAQAKARKLEELREAQAKKLKQAYEAQLKEGWVPKPGEVVFVPKLRSDAKVVSVSGKRLKLLYKVMQVEADVSEVRRK